MNPRPAITSRFEHATTLLAALLLLAMFGLAVGSMAQKAPTFDEQGFIVRGLGYLRGENDHMRVGHPLGLNALSAALLTGDASVRLPVDDPSWQETSFHRPAELFLWEIGNDVARIMFLARIPTIFLGLLLAALAGRWAIALTGRQTAGLLALALIAFDPNILASTRLATTDLGLAAGACLAGFTLWRFLQRPSWGRVVLAGAAFGLLQNTKFTAGLFVPLFALVMVVGLVVQWRAHGRGPWRTLLMLLVAYPPAAFLTLWAAYGFQIGTLPENLPLLPQLGGLTLPLSHHLEQLLDIGGRPQVSTPAFLAGQYSNSGWWYYFPVAFLLKTPLPLLLLFGWALAVTLARLLRRQAGPLTALDQAALLIPGLGYFAFALTTDINLGYRHLLPVLPFLWTWTAVSLPQPQVTKRFSSRLLQPAFLLVTWLIAATCWIYPDFLAYFNWLAGGPDGGWRFLVDSNLDWGQDLDDLDDWMAESGVERVWLSYFGEARPSAYGIVYEGLDSFPPRLMNPQARPLLPTKPAPGFYAISATNLQGVHFADHDQFAWFRSRSPVARLGYSIFLYEVAPEGPPAALLLGGIQPDELDPGDVNRIPTNDLVPRWFDPTQALIVPRDGRGWLALAASAPVNPLLGDFIDASDLAESAGYLFGETAVGRPDLPAKPLATLQQGRGALALRDARVVAEDAASLTLLTVWEQRGDTQPVKLFVHAVAGDSPAPFAQWDGLGAAWEGWRDGDLLVQIHTLTWPESGPPAGTRLLIGAYDPVSGARWDGEPATVELR